MCLRKADTFRLEHFKNTHAPRLPGVSTCHPDEALFPDFHAERVFKRQTCSKSNKRRIKNSNEIDGVETDTYTNLVKDWRHLENNWLKLQYIKWIPENQTLRKTYV